MRYDLPVDEDRRQNQPEGKPDGKPDGIEVRPGRREDARAAAKLWMQSAEDHATYDSVYETSRQAENMMRNFLADLSSTNHSFLFVAESKEGDIVGFVSGELREGSLTFSPKTWASVDDIYISPNYRSLGVGQRLMNLVAEWATQRNANGVSLQVAAGNSRGREFYERLGFREVSIYEVMEFPTPGENE